MSTIQEHTQIKVRLFGSVRDIAGMDTIDVDVKDSDTVRDVVARTVSKVPALSGVLEPDAAGQAYAVAIDRQYVSPDFICAAGSELAVIPPVSGG